MTSTATTRLRFDKQGTGDNSNTWGGNVNTNFDLIDEAIAGVTSYTLSGSKTLTSTNYAADEARNFVQWITGGTGGAVTIPSAQKVYLVRNDASGAVTFAPSGGTAASVAAGATALVFSDGTDCYKMDGLSVTLASGMSTFLGTPSSANLKDTVTDETGSGALVFANSPTLVTPALGTPASGVLSNCTAATQSSGDNSTKLATTAYADAAAAAVGGWTSINAQASTSGTTITFTDDVSGYVDLMVTFEGVSHGGGTEALLAAVYDGSSWSGTIQMSGSVNAASPLYGEIQIINHRRNVCSLRPAIGNTGLSSPAVASTNSYSTAYGLRITGGVDGIRFTWSSGGSFDAGTITLWGREA